MRHRVPSGFKRTLPHHDLTHTTIPRDRYPCCLRDSNPQSQQKDANQRLRPRSQREVGKKINVLRQTLRHFRVLATHSVRQFPLHLPSRASPCAITFQLVSTIGIPLLGAVIRSKRSRAEAVHSQHVLRGQPCHEQRTDNRGITATPSPSNAAAENCRQWRIKHR